MTPSASTMEKRNKVIYWVATGLLSLMMIMSAGMYLFNTEQVSGVGSGLILLILSVST